MRFISWNGFGVPVSWRWTQKVAEETLKLSRGGMKSPDLKILYPSRGEMVITSDWGVKDPALVLALLTNGNATLDASLFFTAIGGTCGYLLLSLSLLPWAEPLSNLLAYMWFTCEERFLEFMSDCVTLPWLSIASPNTGLENWALCFPTWTFPSLQVYFLLSPSFGGRLILKKKSKFFFLVSTCFAEGLCKLLPSRGGVCFLTSWLWAVLVTCSGWMDVLEVALCQCWGLECFCSLCWNAATAMWTRPGPPAGGWEAIWRNARLSPPGHPEPVYS